MANQTSKGGKTPPTIKDYMVTLPVRIELGTSVQTASHLMQRYDIRHLPVVAQGKLVGVISKRDIENISQIESVDPSHVTIDSFMSAPYAVPPNTPLDEVCEKMAELKIGSAIIENSKKILGIFTSIDALHILTDLIRQK